MSEVAKLQQHLALLKEEYGKLQNHCANLERKYSLAAAAAGDLSENSFVARLLTTIATLYGKPTYSDITIKLENKDFPCHKFVLNARSDDWSQQALSKVQELDWSHIPEEITEAILKWIYTDSVDLNKSELLLVQLMKTASSFRLTGLISKCERHLIGVVNVRNCVKFYTAADEINATDLKEHCSTLISAHWDDLTGEDFEHMSSSLLYRMLKDKSEQPLHAAVRLNRGDVVFLCLLDNQTSSNLAETVNAMSSRGELPLEIALRNRAESIAQTLLQHSADVNVTGPRGRTLLHRAIDARDIYTAEFLINNNANCTITTRDESDTALHLIASLSPTSCEEETLEQMINVAERILTKGVDVNAQNRKGFTPLHSAVISRNERMLDLLLKCKELDLNARTSTGEHTPLYYALLDDRRASIGSSDTLVINNTNPMELPITNKNSFGSPTGPIEHIERTFASKLLEGGCEPNPSYSSGDTLMHLLAGGCHEESGVFLTPYMKDLDKANEAGFTTLHIAAANGLSRLVAGLLNAGANCNVQTDYQEADGVYRQTPLHLAVLNNQEQVVQAIIDFKQSADVPNSPDFNIKNSENDTALSLAISEGHMSIVPLLIKGSSDPNVKNGRGFTALHQAILKEDSDTAIFLLNNAADFDALTDETETPLQLAIHCRVPAVVTALCQRGADLSRPDTHGHPPLWSALSSGQEDVASILVRYGADADCWGPGPDGCEQTLLHKAIDENNESIGQFLVRAGCDVQSPRRGEGDAAAEGHAPAHLCCSWGLADLLQTLLEHGADINARDAEGKTPLHLAIESQHAAIISLLLSQPNVDLAARDNRGATPFYSALQVKNNKAAQAILEKMPSAAEQTDKKGRNFLHVAIEQSDMETVMFLLSVEVDVNCRVRDASLTPALQLAAAGGNEVLVRSLLLRGARANDRDARGRSALHAAAENGHHPLVTALASHGADADCADQSGDTPLHLAVKAGKLQAVRALIIDACAKPDVLNSKGRNPLHELCCSEKDNAAAICDQLLELVPDYPLDKTDANGNTPLLLAYMKGQGAICRTLVRAGACLACENKEGMSIFNCQVATRQLLHRLLDWVPSEAAWGESDHCQECANKFTAITFRKHHCRHCGRVLCSKCSNQEVPILKFNVTKPTRVCQLCFNVLQLGAS